MLKRILSKLWLVLKSKNFWGHFWFYWLAIIAMSSIFAYAEVAKVPKKFAWLLVLIYIVPPIVWELVTNFFHPFIKKTLEENKKNRG